MIGETVTSISHLSRPRSHAKSQVPFCTHPMTRPASHQLTLFTQKEKRRGFGDRDSTQTTGFLLPTSSLFQEETGALPTATANKLLRRRRLGAALKVEEEVERERDWWIGQRRQRRGGEAQQQQQQQQVPATQNNLCCVFSSCSLRL